MVQIMILSSYRYSTAQVEVGGIEPPSLPCKGSVLPLNYTPIVVWEGFEPSMLPYQSSAFAGLGDQTEVAQRLLRLPRPPAGHGVPASTSTVQQGLSDETLASCARICMRKCPFDPGSAGIGRAAGFEPATTALATQRSPTELCPLEFYC